MTLKFIDDGSGNSYTAMGVPGQLSTSNVTANSADLTLPTGVGGAQYYELTESTDNGSTWTVVDSAIAPNSIVSPATYSRSGLTSGATYQWRLRARFASLVSPLYSAVRSVVTSAGGGTSPVLSGTPVFADGFESGDMSTTNADGFSWSSLNRTSIVTQDPTNGATQIYPSVVVVGAGRDWTAYDGNNSLRFRMPALTNQAEQRFVTGTHYPDCWVSYWLRVPTNFTASDLNAKFLVLFCDTYDVAGDVTWQLRPDGNGGAVLNVQDGGVTHGEAFPVQFINVPSDRGRWMQVVAHYKSASSSSANDGVIQMFRRWDGDTAFTTIHDDQTANTFESGAATQGVANGRILGWVNSSYSSAGGYQSDTEWLVDDFAIYTSSPL